MNKIWNNISGLWYEIIISLGALIVFGMLLVVNLSKQPHLLSNGELQTLTSSHNLDFAHLNPINLLYTFPLHFALRLHSSTGSLRVISVIYGVALLVILYSILTYLFDALTSAAGVALVAVSSWFLNLSRVGTPEILYAFGGVVLIATCMIFMHTRLKNMTFILFLGCLALLVYIPGFIWLVGGLIFWSHRRILISLKRISNYEKVIAVLLGVGLLLPLGWALAQHPNLIRPVLGLPDHFGSIISMLRNLANIPLTIFYRAPINPQYSLGNLPMLNVIEIVLFAFGLYSLYLNNRKSEPRNVVIYGLIACIALISVGGPVSIAILLPITYLVIILGLIYLWKIWIAVFPKNPIAKYLGFGILTVVLIFSINYHLRRYFIAWQGSPTTQQVFSHSFPQFDTIITFK